MATQISPLTIDGKHRVQALLERAALDIRFRELLMRDPDTALADTDLTGDERQAIVGLKHVALEEWGVDVRAFRGFLVDNGNGFTKKTTPGQPTTHRPKPKQ